MMYDGRVTEFCERDSYALSGRTSEHPVSCVLQDSQKKSRYTRVKWQVLVTRTGVQSGRVLVRAPAACLHAWAGRRHVSVAYLES